MPQHLCADDHIRVRIVNVYVHIPILIYAAVLFCLRKCLVDHFFAGKSVRVLHHRQRHIRLSHQCVVGIVFQHHPSVALTGGGFCFLRLPLRRVKSRLPLLCNVLQLGKVLAVCLLRRHVAVFAGERGFDLGKKFL